MSWRRSFQRRWCRERGETWRSAKPVPPPKPLAVHFTDLRTELADLRAVHKPGMLRRCAGWLRRMLRPQARGI